MAFVPVPDSARVVVEGTLGPQACVNTFYFRNTSGWGLTEMEELAAVVDAAWGTDILPIMGAAYDYVRTVVTDARVQFAEQAIDSTSAGSGSLSGSGVVPNNAALAIKRVAGLTGRSTRGRIFLPVTDTANLAGEVAVTSTFGNAATAAMNDMLTAALVYGWEGVIASFVQNGVPLVTAAVYGITEYLLTDLNVDSMRRRLAGRGST